MIRILVYERVSKNFTLHDENTKLDRSQKVLSILPELHAG
jgi:hypothetical protein